MPQLLLLLTAHFENAGEGAEGGLLQDAAAQHHQPTVHHCHLPGRDILPGARLLCSCDVSIGHYSLAMELFLLPLACL